jgi:hypothetical protein
MNLDFKSKRMIDPDTAIGKTRKDFFVRPSASVLAGIPVAVTATSQLLIRNFSTIARAEANAMKLSFPFDNATYFHFLLNKLKSCVG